MIMVRTTVMALVVALLFGAASLAYGAPRSPRDTLVVAQGFDPRCLSPLFGTAQQDKNVSGQVVERLVQFSPDSLGFLPELAIRWEKTAPDTLRVHLRRGVRFTNGEEFNAQSAKYSLDQMLASRALAFFVSHVRAAEVVDFYTVDVKARGPVSERMILTALAMGSFQYPPQYTQQVGLLQGFCQRPIGTGPYKFVEWVKDDRVVFEANPDYWGGAPRTRRLIFRPIPEGAARVAALQAGDIDLAVAVPLDAVDRISADPNLTTHSIRGMRVFGLMLSQKWEGPLQHKKVRQTLQYAIDVDGIIRTVLKGRARRVMGQPLTPEYFGYQQDFKGVAYDPDRAKKMLAEAGFPNGFQVTFKYPSGRYPQDKEISEVIASQLLKVGIRTQQVVMEPGEFLTQLSQLGLRDMFFFGTLPPPDAHFMYTQFVCDFRYAYWCRKDFDALMARASATSDDKERLKLYREMALIFQDDPPLVNLFAASDLYATAKSVAGWRPYKDQFLYLAKVYKRE
ncbi:MAG: ABC transporter substrate-binding protein [Armatimonadota bacterium]|nr:ABC transporter substrate-binding protein [Armatimonadota bacterium]